MIPSPNGTGTTSVAIRFGTCGATVWAGWKLGWGPDRWRESTTLAFVARSAFPWWLLGMGLIVGALLILVPRRVSWWEWPRLVGWWMLFALYGYGAVSLDVAVHHNSQTPYNPLPVAAFNIWAYVCLVAMFEAIRAARKAR